MKPNFAIYLRQNPSLPSVNVRKTQHYKDIPPIQTRGEQGSKQFCEPLNPFISKDKYKICVIPVLGFWNTEVNTNNPTQQRTRKEQC